MKLADLKKLCDEASLYGWDCLPGVGENEDDGDFIVGAVGPAHSFLLGDVWEHDPDMKPMGLLSEKEARRRAAADQAFIIAARTAMPKLITAVEAAFAVLDDLPSGDTFGANNFSAAQHRAKALRVSLAELGREMGFKKQDGNFRREGR